MQAEAPPSKPREQEAGEPSPISAPPSPSRSVSVEFLDIPPASDERPRKRQKKSVTRTDESSSTFVCHGELENHVYTPHSSIILYIKKISGKKSKNHLIQRPWEMSKKGE